MHMSMPMSAAVHPLTDIQRSFAAGLMNAASAPPLAIAAGDGARVRSAFSVYRNSVRLGLIKALMARFPTVVRLLGEETFVEVAALFIAHEPPRSALLMFYGEGFPNFLRRIGRARSAYFVADIAEIEAARTKACHAADAEPVSAAAFAALEEEELGRMRLALHPSLTLLRFESPAVTAWRANQGDGDNRLTQWRAEDAMIARPRLDVGVWLLPPGCFSFLAALAGGAALADAANRGADSNPAFDLVETLSLLITSEVVTAICDTSRS